jgi:thiamine pyrophosphate-dependent acetolactate synthase large subunit-like protein
MTSASGGEAIVAGLVAHGVDTVSGLPGAQIDAFQQARLTVIGARHEQGCGYMAYGYARSSGKVRRDQRERFDGRVVASDLVNPDFVKLAESFGVGAARVTSPETFRSALEKALADGGPYLIAVEIPKDSEASPWPFIHPERP